MTADLGMAPGVDFPVHRIRATQILSRLHEQCPMNDLYEQATPAYLGGNLFSRWLFWHRLEAVLTLLPAANRGTCLDFGCGTGVLLPALGRLYNRVFAVDLIPETARRFLRIWAEDYGEGVNNIEVGTKVEEFPLAAESLDLIVALDVLEHIDQLPETLQQMSMLLKPRGTLLVCGPTENWIYRLGRGIVGFSGDYHRRNIYDIEKQLGKFFDTFRIRCILPFAPLFLVVLSRKHR